MEEHNLKQIELLLSQSLNGIHLLFEHHMVANILRIPTEELNLFDCHNMDKVQDLFNRLIEKDSFFEKQEFIHDLDQESYEILVRTYFHIVDNTAMIASNYQH